MNNNIPTNGNKRWLTVGAKLLIGVALASNCFIGALLTINYQSTLHIEQMVAKVLAIREQVDVNLRDTIVKLQQEFTALPRLFQTDPKTALLEQDAPVTPASLPLLMRVGPV